jgi:hypothetical protein
MLTVETVTLKNKKKGIDYNVLFCLCTGLMFSVFTANLGRTGTVKTKQTEWRAHDLTVQVNVFVLDSLQLSM